MGSAVHPCKDDDIVYSPNKYRETEGIKDTNDPTALFCGLIDRDNKKLWVFDEMYKKGMSNESIAEKIKSMGYGKEIITADSAEPKSNDRLRTLGINRLRSAKKGKDSINAGIDFLQDYEIIIHPKCVNFITEIGNYQWDKDKFGNAVNKPIDDFNHCVTGDTMVETVYGSKQIKELVGTQGEIHAFDLVKNKPVISEYFDCRKTRSSADIYEIETVDGRKIRLTKDHPILTKRGFIEVKDLKANDEILDIEIDNHKHQSIHTNDRIEKNGLEIWQTEQSQGYHSYVKIKSIKYIGTEDVYNMEVKDHHNFAVCGGLIVHNCMDAMRYGTERFQRGNTFSFD